MALHNKTYSDELILEAKRLLVEGKTAREVALATGIVQGTVYNYKNELIREFQRLIDKLKGKNETV